MRKSYRVCFLILNMINYKNGMGSKDKSKDKIKSLDKRLNEKAVKSKVYRSGLSGKKMYVSAQKGIRGFFR